MGQYISLSLILQAISVQAMIISASNMPSKLALMLKSQRKYFFARKAARKTLLGDILNLSQNKVNKLYTWPKTFRV